MRIHALTTGTVEIKTAMHRGRRPLRLLRTLLDRAYTAPLPIHAWLIEHPDGPILVDTGDLATTGDPPIARFHISREQEIDRALEGVGCSVADLKAVVLTHLHGDHMNGLGRLPGTRVLVSADALGWGGARRLRRRGVSEPEAVELADRPFGAFARSAALTADGRVLAVPTPGHTSAHIAVIVIEEDHHVLIGGDSAYTQSQLLDLHPDGVSPSARSAVRSMGTIVDHARRHATVYLPSHDPDSAARLGRREPVFEV
ncbi:MAG TPA: MBL fold metallo-hydrolase [Solirubrobacteraceae bacterium]|nr:MBL fold metallo-hydrolase [Solirubrobacteraceae bacterium]